MKLLEALSYREYCPFCIHKLSSSHSQNQVNILDTKIIIKSSDIELFINPYTDKIIEIKHKSSYSDMYDVGVSGQSIRIRNSKPVNNFNGDMILGVNVECVNCAQYSYTLSLFLDLTSYEFKSAHLNAEWMSLEEGKDVFEIRNSYGLGITQYTFFPIDAAARRIDLPLVPLNLSNPKETLARIRNLIIFT